MKKVRNTKPPKKNHIWRKGIYLGNNEQYYPPRFYRFEDSLKVKADMDFIMNICKDSITDSL